jgi:hypothetical protein
VGGSGNVRLDQQASPLRDYETKPGHQKAMIYIAMIMNMSRRLARTGDW